MEYVYAALLLHKLGKTVDEDGLKKVITATGAEVDDGKVKLLVASLKDVNIDEELEKAVAAAPGAGSESEAPKEEPKKDNSITQEQLLGIIKDALKEQVAGSNINNVEINETDGKWEMTITTDNGDDLQYWRIKPVEVDKRTW